MASYEGADAEQFLTAHVDALREIGKAAAPLLRRGGPAHHAVEVSLCELLTAFTSARLGVSMVSETDAQEASEAAYRAVLDWCEKRQAVGAKEVSSVG
jgi:hypothetical protein